jgi:hypothetical protein
VSDGAPARAVAADGAPTAGALREMIKSQYHAALAMLREAVERCPDALWLGGGTNACWQLAYHALFFAHLYSCADEHAFRPWDGHRADVQYPDGIGGPPDPADSRPVVARPYTKDEVLAYWRFCDERVDAAVDATDLSRTESGFPWYPIPKLEHQLVNVRHVQHHAAQIADRLRAHLDVGVAWAGARRPPAAT